MKVESYYRRIRLELPLALLMVLAVQPVAAGTIDPYEELNNSWDRFGSVYERVVEHYYSDIDHKAVMEAAIEGLLRKLDAYTQYFDEEGLRQLRQDTTGKFAGLGITVGIKDQYPVVIAPIEGTPASRAGMEPGDLITAVDGLETFGMSLEEVVSTLRGDPGSEVRLTLNRRGEPANWDVDVVREIIKIKSVAVADMIAPGVGYISLKQTRFSEDTAHEVEASLERLAQQGLESLVLDLRGNPGGLLAQATQVADLFLPKSDPIVTIRERRGRQSETKLSQRDPAVDIPLVVLIDGGSASAAEIVAGAIQDNDRGLVLGTPSFGKGSVQTIFDLGDAERGALKLTTALYYTPSGRNIHKELVASPSVLYEVVPLAGVELPAGLLLASILGARDAGHAVSELAARFELEPAVAEQILQVPLGMLVGHDPDPSESGSGESIESFRTRNGRRVFGNGGITPDVTVESEKMPYPIQSLHRKRAFFDFVVEYVGDDSLSSESSEPFIDDRMLSAFDAFLVRIEPASSPGTIPELSALRDLKAVKGWGPEVTTLIDSLERVIASQATQSKKSDDLEKFIRRGLRKELALRLNGKRASLLIGLESDVQIREAMDLVSDRDRYTSLLKTVDVAR